MKGVKRHLRVEGELTVRKKNDRQQEGRRHWGRKDKKKQAKAERKKDGSEWMEELKRKLGLIKRSRVGKT